MPFSDTPLIVAFIADLMFSRRVETTAELLGFGVELIERATQITPSEELPVPIHQIGEQTTGPGAALMERLTLWKPALILFDLSNTEIPWRQWLPLIKSAPATRRIPVVAYGSHVDAETMKLAASCGADAVLARSRFSADLPEILQKYARKTDPTALNQACQGTLSELALRGLEEFNRGLYFEAHESLEAAWKEDVSVGRDLYQAILQVAVAYLQIERGNYTGAQKMFWRVRQWIDPLPDTCRGVDVARLRLDADRVRQLLMALGAERIGEFDRRLFKQIIYQEPI
jgi:CheY-like chemotaxis protein